MTGKKKKINPQADKLVVISRALDMSLADLLGDDGAENTGVDYSAEENIWLSVIADRIIM